MSSYTLIYQKRGSDVVPVVTIDDFPSPDSSSSGHLVDSNGIALAIAAVEEKIPDPVDTDLFVTVDTEQDVYAGKIFSKGASFPNIAGGSAAWEVVDSGVADFGVMWDRAVNYIAASGIPATGLQLSFRFSEESFLENSECIVTSVVIIPNTLSQDAIIRWPDGVLWADGEVPDFDPTKYQLFTFMRVASTGGMPMVFGTHSVRDGA